MDLATIVSKYIGETEKNLERIFTAADGSNAILFFDEADALFGKRSEVSDSHDRYANIEVAYLLQRMEAYPGAVILATNFRRNIDDAFVRRLDFLIDFPFPEAEDRRRIWRLVLPAAAPLADDVDFDFLAERFKLSGGAIRNCSLAAAFRAADEGSQIEMRHLVRAVAQEYGKQGRLTLETDFERFHAMVRDVGRKARGLTDRQLVRAALRDTVRRSDQGSTGERTGEMAVDRACGGARRAGGEREFARRAGGSDQRVRDGHGQRRPGGDRRRARREPVVRRSWRTRSAEINPSTGAAADFLRPDGGQLPARGSAGS